MANAKNIVLLCEDDPQEQFVSECLARIGVCNLKHRMERINASRTVHGGNVEYVENRAVVEASAWSVRNSKAKTLLVIVADADEKLSRDQRRNRLPSGNGAELLVVVIPKRNIETWVKLGLERDPEKAVLSDQEDYKSPRYSCAPSPRRAAEVLCGLLVKFGAKAPEGGVLSDCLFDLTALRNGVQALES